MKKYAALAILILTATWLNAQSKYKHKFFSAGFQPQYTLHAFATNSRPLRDSLAKMEQDRGGFAIALQFERQLGKNLKFQTGITYTNTGFIRQATNLTSETVLHPDVGPINQSVETQPGILANMHYVFDYIDVVGLFNSRLAGKRSKHWAVYGTYGLSLNFLLQDRVAFRLEGFAINGEMKFNEKNTYLSPKFFNITAHAGFRADYKHSNYLGFYTQPVLNLPLLPATSGDLSYRLVSVGVQVGVFYNLDTKGEEELVK